LKNNSFTFEVVPVYQVNQQEAMEFAQQHALVSAHYLRERFVYYDEMVTARRLRKLQSFQFIQRFNTVNNEHFIYFGPLFSNHGSYLPMFIHYLEDIYLTSAHRTVHLVAEIQNPEILVVYHFLFGDYLYPQLTKPIPCSVQTTARKCAEKLVHIKNLNSEVLSTFSSETLFKPKQSYEPVMKWLEARGIDFTNGDSQMVVVTIPSNRVAREKVIQYVKDRSIEIRNWKTVKKTLIKQFMEAVQYV
jgi:hypothetical protein